MKEQFTYSVDSQNRLLLGAAGETHAVDGYFGVQPGNRLSYWLNQPLPWQKRFMPGQRIDFQGAWRLTSAHDLEFILKKEIFPSASQPLLLTITFVAAENDALVVSVLSKGRNNQSHIRIMRLAGLWQADSQNRITFIVEGRPDYGVLVFRGSWRLNDQQEIEYVFEKRNAVQKKTMRQRIVFKGFWHIDAARKIAYVFEGDSRSRFDFRVQLESPTLYPKKNEIRYRVGIGAKQGITAKFLTLSLFGEWKFGRRAGIQFEMNYGAGKVRALTFATQIRPGQGNEITVTLLSKDHKPLGMSLVYSRQLFQKTDARLFIRLQKAREESSALAGVVIPF